MTAPMAEVTRDHADGRARVVFDEPVRAATKGQIAVLYDEHEQVLGGGRIASVAS